MKTSYIILGDTFALLVITVIGFATHGETSLEFIPRMFTTWLPLLIGWALVAPWLGLFDPVIVRAPRQLWRPGWALLLAAPIAGVLRAVMLQTTVLPFFVLILGTSAALGMITWRGLLLRWLTRK